MMAVDANESLQQPAQLQNDNDQHAQRLMSMFQVTRSLASLLLTSQRSVDGNIGKMANFLACLSRFIMGLQDHEDAHSLKYTEMTGQFFRFYHKEVLRAVQRSSSSLNDSDQGTKGLNLDGEEPHTHDLCHHRDIIASFIEASKSNLGASQAS